LFATFFGCFYLQIVQFDIRQDHAAVSFSTFSTQLMLPEMFWKKFKNVPNIAH
jgi:hypothetical protein